MGRRVARKELHAALFGGHPVGPTVKRALVECDGPSVTVRVHVADTRGAGRVGAGFDMPSGGVGG